MNQNHERTVKPVLKGNPTFGKLVFSGKRLQSQGSKFQAPLLNIIYADDGRDPVPCVSVKDKFQSDFVYCNIRTVLNKAYCYLDKTNRINFSYRSVTRVYAVMAVFPKDTVVLPFAMEWLTSQILLDIAQRQWILFYRGFETRYRCHL